MNKPDEDARKHGLSRKKMFCARKNKFSLNMQAVSNCGGASADCIAFEASDLYIDLKNGLLHDDLTLYGDNAYVNKSYMATSISNVSGGGEDI